MLSGGSDMILTLKVKGDIRQKSVGGWAVLQLMCVAACFDLLIKQLSNLRWVIRALINCTLSLFQHSRNIII